MSAATVPTFVTREDERVSLACIRKLEKLGYNTRILSIGEVALPQEVVLIDDKPRGGFHTGWEGNIQIAAHRFLFCENLPDFITGPFVAKVRLINGRVRTRSIRSLAKRYGNFFADPRKHVTPWGKPYKVSSSWFKEWISDAHRTLNLA